MEGHFKILSLTVHKGGNAHLLKALKADVEYPFYQEKDVAPSWLYDIAQGPKVSVSCIVGKNGDGKSSITEMMIRVINNFAYLAGFRENQPNLTFVPGVRATIKYCVCDKECSLSCMDDEVTLVIPGKEPLKFKRRTSKRNNPPKQRLLDVKDYLFYMFVSNYSLNSFNSRDFIGETGNRYDWLTPLFHKNDGYQTPVNLNPMRTDGQININQEHELSKQRLMSLFTEATEKRCSNNYNNYDVPSGEGFAFKLSGESKLEKHTFSDYFQKQRGVRYTKNKIAFDEETHFAFWERNASMILCKEEFINSIHNHINVNKKERTDFSDYLNYFYGLIIVKGQCSDKVIKVIRMLQGYPNFSFLEFQRVFLVIWLEREWNKSKLLLKPFNLQSVNVNKNNLRINARKYILYKTVSIFETYPLLYDGCMSKIEKPINFFAYPTDENGFESRMKQAFCSLVDDIKTDRSFITLKIRQCINYLNHFLDYENWNIRSKEAEYNIPGKNYTHYVSFIDLLQDIRKNTDGPVIDFLPPPIFEGEIILRSGDKVYPTSHISSGERQMLNMVGAVVYHLRNLGSSPEKGRSFRYRNIHVFLDEIELCFHPSYQRNMINFLLGQISAAHLPEDMRISITLLTHSPFVLSDVPQGNILYLKDGRPVNERIKINPFAANVNDVLQQSFFLEDGFTGTFASSKIQSLIEFLSSNKQSKKQDKYWKEEEIKQFISIIGEPLMRYELTRLYWNWKISTGKLGDDEKKRKVEELARELGGSVQW